MSKLQKNLIDKLLKASNEISNKSRKGSRWRFYRCIMDTIKEERIIKINNILDELKRFKY